MSAELLRRAASLMRERAEAATPGPWHKGEQHGRDFTDEGWSEVVVFSDVAPAVASGYPGVPLAATCLPGFSDSDECIEDAEHIASWHPAVALAVADWLDHEAQIAEEDAADGYTMGPRYPGLILARAYLGEDA